MKDQPSLGDLWWCEMPELGRRPVLVLSRDEAITRRRMSIVAPCTTKIRSLPSEVILEPGADPVPEPTAVNLDSIENVSTAFLVQRLGRLSYLRMQEVCAALEVAVACAR